MTKILILLFAFATSFFGSFAYMNYIKSPPILSLTDKTEEVFNFNENISNREVIGFLPFWLLSSAKKNYSKYINNLSIFSLIVDSDGSIKKFTIPGEGEPGYYSLVNGKFDEYIKNAKLGSQKLSLVLFSGKDSDIDLLIQKPTENAKKLMSEVNKIVKDYGFNEINLDIEKVSDASASARLNFIEFVKEFRNETINNNLTLSIDVVASSFVKDTNLVDPYEVSKYVDKVIIMAYDFHYIGSFVTGAVAPLNGAGTISEFDVETSVVEAIQKIPSEKIILGIPLYGYEWESITSFPRSAVIPSTGLTISNKRAEEKLNNCIECKVEYDLVDNEMSIVYKNLDTNFYHQIFYPEKRSMESKLKLAEKYKLGGVALWALGYEGETILDPLYGWYR